MAIDRPSPPQGGPLDRLSSLREHGKDPASKNVLNAWVNQAQPQVGLDTGRLGWLIASTVVVAALQRAIDEDGRSRFLLKGGTYLQHRLSWTGRPTKDIDGMVRGDIRGIPRRTGSSVAPAMGTAHADPRPHRGHRHP
jgi:hypothetical protein